MEVLCALFSFSILIALMLAASAGCLTLAGVSVKQMGKLAEQLPRPTPQPGQVTDHLDGRIRKNAPEERVRQTVLGWLLGQGLSPTQLNTEFPVQMGSSTRYIDIAVFRHGQTHHQDNVWVVIECKRKDLGLSLHEKGVLQLKSYLAVCPNAEYGLFTTSDKHVILKRDYHGNHLCWLPLDAIPNLAEG